MDKLYFVNIDRANPEESGIKCYTVMQKTQNYILYQNKFADNEYILSRCQLNKILRPSARVEKTVYRFYTFNKSKALEAYKAIVEEIKEEYDRTIEKLMWIYSLAEKELGQNLEEEE